jgi:chitin disaccharide deacetylase
MKGKMTVMTPKEIILITRADDMGYTHTGNVAILECLRNGIIRSAAILVISPWFEETAMIAHQNSDLCFGVHLGIIGEWQGCRWRPVLPYSAVKSLVDEDGFLWQSPNEFWAHNPDMGELEQEFTAQIDLALKKGVPIAYLDTHYVMPYNERFRPIVERLGKKYGLPVSCLLGEHELDDFGIYSVPPEDKERVLEQVLKSLEPGVHLLIAHPGLASLENDALVHSEPLHIQAMGTGRLRAAETLAYTSPRIKRLINEQGIKLMSYAEFCEHAARLA